MYDFYYDSEPIKDFNFNTIFYIDDYWLDLETVINDAINIEIAEINAKYGVDITYEWDFLCDLDYITPDRYQEV